MHPNAELIQRFYTAFKNKDYITMQRCYTDNASFTDEAFVNLNAAEVRAMWEMLIKSGKDLTLEYSNIQANDTTGSAMWVATYTFSRTGNKVVNHIQAEFAFSENKIVSHRDHFNFYKWSRQALGLTGWMLGWTSPLQKKVQQTARKSLQAFME